MTSAPLPTLAQFLGDGSRSEDFEHFVAHVHELMSAYPQVTGDTRRRVKFMRGFSIAAGEIARPEADGTPEDALQVCRLMLQGGTVAMANTLLSILEDVPAAVFAEYVTEAMTSAIAEVVRVHGLK